MAHYFDNPRTTLNQIEVHNRLVVANGEEKLTDWTKILDLGSLAGNLKAAVDEFRFIKVRGENLSKDIWKKQNFHCFRWNYKYNDLTWEGEINWLDRNESKKGKFFTTSTLQFILPHNKFIFSPNQASNKEEIDVLLKNNLNEFKRTISTLYQLVEHPNNLAKEKVTIELLYKHPIEQFEIFIKGKISLSEQWCLHLIIQYGTPEEVKLCLPWDEWLNGEI